MMKKDKDYVETDLKISENKEGKMHKGDIEGLYEAKYESKIEKMERDEELDITNKLHQEAVDHVKKVHDLRGEKDKEVVEDIPLTTFSAGKNKEHYGDIEDMAKGNRRGRFDTGELDSTTEITDTMHDKAIKEEVTHQDKYKK